jgi:beta-alanine degradation protein BauB
MLGSLTARSEDDRAMSKAVPTFLIDNERVRVTEWRFAPGAATGWHRHALDYVVVPMADGVLELTGRDDVRTHAELRKGVPYFRNAGVEHDVINANAFEFAFIEVELK